jgi:hypothetical protein
MMLPVRSLLLASIKVVQSSPRTVTVLRTAAWCTVAGECIPEPCASSA